MSFLIRNCRLISPGVDTAGASIEIEGGRIRAVHAAGDPLPEIDRVFDARGQMALPGFIDIHTHGAMGRDFSDGTLEAVETVAEAKLREGVTTVLPSLFTLQRNELASACAAVAEYAADPRFAKAPGVHLEGPYLNPEHAGAQNPAALRLPDMDEVKALHEVVPVVLVALAIELEGALPAIRVLKEMGIATSAAHSAATFGQFQAAREAGLGLLTHYCNQMSRLHHREIGLVGAGLQDDGVLLELICDRIHLCDDMIRLIFKLKSIDSIVLITDSIAASGMDDGDYSIGGLDVRVRDGIARLAADESHLAGSTLRMCQALRNAHLVTGLPLSELVKTTSLNQAQSLGLAGVGKLESGYLADIVVLADDFTPVAVFVEGQRRAGGAAQD